LTASICSHFISSIASLGEFTAWDIFNLTKRRKPNARSWYVIYAIDSTSVLNSGGTQQAVFGKPKELLPLVIEPPDKKTFAANPGDFTSGGSLFNEGVAISFDDGGNGADADFQDFTLTALAEAEAEEVPQPMTMTGLALRLGGLVAARRRRGSKTAS